MINLLPPHTKKELRKEYRIRASVVFLCAVLIVEVLTFAFFIPSYYVLSLSTKKLTQDLEQRQLISPEENKEVSAELATIRKEMALLKPAGSGSSTPSQLLREILGSKPKGIEVLTFSYTNIKNKVDIQLSGVAGTREDLLAFRKNLLTMANISDVKFGSSFITKKTEIDFSMVISIK